MNNSVKKRVFSLKVGENEVFLLCLCRKLYSLSNEKENICEDTCERRNVYTTPWTSYEVVCQLNTGVSRQLCIRIWGWYPMSLRLVPDTLHNGTINKCCTGLSPLRFQDWVVALNRAMLARDVLTVQIGDLGQHPNFSVQYTGLHWEAVLLGHPHSLTCGGRVGRYPSSKMRQASTGEAQGLHRMLCDNCWLELKIPTVPLLWEKCNVFFFFFFFRTLRPLTDPLERVISTVQEPFVLPQVYCTSQCVAVLSKLSEGKVINKRKKGEFSSNRLYVSWAMGV